MLKIQSVHISAPTNVARSSLYDLAVWDSVQITFLSHVNRAKKQAMLTRDGAECLVDDAGLIAYLLCDHGFRVVISSEKVSL